MEGKSPDTKQQVKSRSPPWLKGQPEEPSKTSGQKCSQVDKSSAQATQESSKTYIDPWVEAKSQNNTGRPSGIIPDPWKTYHKIDGNNPAPGTAENTSLGDPLAAPSHGEISKDSTLQPEPKKKVEDSSQNAASGAGGFVQSSGVSVHPWKIPLPPGERGPIQDTQKISPQGKVGESVPSSSETVDPCKTPPPPGEHVSPIKVLVSGQLVDDPAQPTSGNGQTIDVQIGQGNNTQSVHVPEINSDIKPPSCPDTQGEMTSQCAPPQAQSALEQAVAPNIQDTAQTQSSQAQQPTKQPAASHRTRQQWSLDYQQQYWQQQSYIYMQQQSQQMQGHSNFSYYPNLTIHPSAMGQPSLPTQSFPFPHPAPGFQNPYPTFQNHPMPNPYVAQQYGACNPIYSQSNAYQNDAYHRTFRLNDNDEVSVTPGHIIYRYDTKPKTNP